MKSWDCFDTLIARKFITPTSIFEEIGRKINDKDFGLRRVEARFRSGETSLDAIYSHLPSYDPNVELQVEYDHCYPIVENMQQVQDGDIIVSDMYLNIETIRNMLKKCGLTKDVEIYVTTRGKADGWIWDELEKKPDLHIGDNKIGDYDSPIKHGISAYHYINSNKTEIEEWVYKYNQNLSSFMRFLRLQCPWLPGSAFQNLWKDQANINIPILILASKILMKRVSKEKIFFNHRDCIFWKPIFEELFKVKTEEIHTSRYFYKEAPLTMILYMKHVGIDNNSIIVDLNGSGESFNNFDIVKNELCNEHFLKEFIAFPILFNISGKDKHYNNVEQIFKYTLNEDSGWLEKLNIASYGSATGWDVANNQLLRADYEYDPKIHEIQNQVVQTALANLNSFDNLFNENDSHILETLFTKYAKNCWTAQNINLYHR